MALYAIIWVLIIFATYIVCRAVYERVRFFFKLLSLRRRLKKLDRNGMEVEYLQKFSKIAFGDKGRTNFTVKTKDKIYRVTVLAFAVTRGRWNIEKAEDRYYAEVRAYNNMFYRVHNNSGTEPEHSKDYRRETRITRKRLYLSEEKTEGEKILLVYPKPKALTYADYKFHYASSGDKIFGYTALYEDDFFEMLQA